MSIEKSEAGSGGQYLLRGDGGDAVMTYSRTSPRLVIIDHTEVSDALRGQGAGARLAEFAVDDARAGGWKIIPLCPFFRSQVEKHPEWRDVINR